LVVILVILSHLNFLRRDPVNTKRNIIIFYSLIDLRQVVLTYAVM